MKMKTAYELAMERLAGGQSEAAKPLTEEQKQEIADIEQRTKAHIAEKEVMAQKEIGEAKANRDNAALEEAHKNLREQRKRLEEDAEAAKERVRQGH